MENNSKMKDALQANSIINKKIEIIEKEIQPAPYEQSLDRSVVKEEEEKNLNAKILELTMTIMNKYPELSKYIEEMPSAIPDQSHPEITPMNLNAYYNSLTEILNKYILQHPDETK